MSSKAAVRYEWKQTVEDLAVYKHLRLMLLLKETEQVASAYLRPWLESISQGLHA